MDNTYHFDPDKFFKVKVHVSEISQKLVKLVIQDDKMMKQQDVLVDRTKVTGIQTVLLNDQKDQKHYAVHSIFSTDGEMRNIIKPGDILQKHGSVPCDGGEVLTMIKDGYGKLNILRTNDESCLSVLLSTVSDSSKKKNDTKKKTSFKIENIRESHPPKTSGKSKLKLSKQSIKKNDPLENDHAEKHKKMDKKLHKDLGERHKKSKKFQKSKKTRKISVNAAQKEKYFVHESAALSDDENFNDETKPVKPQPMVFPLGAKALRLKINKNEADQDDFPTDDDVKSITFESKKEGAKKAKERKKEQDTKPIEEGTKASKKESTEKGSETAGKDDNDNGKDGGSKDESDTSSDETA